MKTTEYLYGIQPTELDNKFYYEALEYKLDKGSQLYRELYPNSKDKETNDRIFFVLKALDHTRELLEERKGEL